MPDAITLSAWVKFCHVNFSRWGNPCSLLRICERLYWRKICFRSGVECLFKVTIESDRTESCSRKGKRV